MKKTVLALVVLATAGSAGVYFANNYAEDMVKQQVEQANQSYRQLAANGDMPLISLTCKELSKSKSNLALPITRLPLLTSNTCPSSELFA